MSVRRLAEDEVQPKEFAFNRANAAWAKKKLKDYPKGRQASGVIPLLMRAQEQDGWVTKAAIEHVAGMLDMPLIRVLEVATFYTQFQLQPVGTRAHIQVCGTTPCMLRGSEELMKVCKRKISEKQFETNGDGTLSWEEVECQGACVNAPMIMVFKDTYEDLTPERLEEIIDAFEAGDGAKIPVGPQIQRVFSAPEGGLTSLTSLPGGKVNGKASAAKGKAKPKASAKSSQPMGLVSSIAAKSSEAKPATKKATSAKASTAKPTSAKTTGAGKVAKSVAKPAASAKKPAPKKEAANKADADRPAGIKKPKQPDDLKLISGVGPKLEGVLNGLGIYTFAQVASWKKKERDWVDGYLKFKGRIERDDWVKQAKALAKGGEAEYIRVFGKKPR